MIGQTNNQSPKQRLQLYMCIDNIDNVNQLWFINANRHSMHARPPPSASKSMMEQAVKVTKNYLEKVKKWKYCKWWALNVVNALLHNSFLNKYLSRYNSVSFVYHEQLNRYECKVKSHMKLYYCGMFSHSKPILSAEREETVVISALMCSEMAKIRT